MPAAAQPGQMSGVRMANTIGDDMFIGARVKFWRRRRGRSQRVLAGLAGMSQPYLSQIESGQRPVERRATLVALANALDVSVADLVGQPGDPTDPMKAAAAAQVPAIREALIRRDVGELGTVRPGSAQTVAVLADAGSAYDFAKVAPMLPEILGCLRGPALVQAAYIGAFTLKHLGYPDLARDASRLAFTEARGLDDPAWIGVAEIARILTMPPEMPGTPLRLAQRVADEIQPRSGQAPVREVYGMLHLYAAHRAAIDQRAGMAIDHLREAELAAASLGEPPDRGLAQFMFGPTNVGMWKTSVLLELGRPRHALETAAGVEPGRLPTASRQAPFLVDVATALADIGKDDEAIAAFLRAEAVGPQFVRLRPTARDTVTSIVRRTKRTAISKQMRLAAAAVGAHDLVRDR